MELVPLTCWVGEPYRCDQSRSDITKTICHHRQQLPQHLQCHLGKFKKEKTIRKVSKGVFDVYPGSRIRNYPSPTQEHGSRVLKIPDPGSGCASKS
jgi:hypothetical protein